MLVRIPPTAAAAHPVTAEAGGDILRAGGSAVDAAVAMLLVACSAEALFTGLSGGGFATVYDAQVRAVRCVDFFVTVPGLGARSPGPSTPIEVEFVGQRVPYAIGSASVAVHGVPAGARHLWERWGRLPWADVVAPGIAAAHGTPFPQAHADLLPQVAAAMCLGEGAQVFAHPDGSHLRAGESLHHPDWPHALELLADDPHAFYHGAFAEALLAVTADAGGIDQQDLSAYRVIEHEPQSVRFAGPSGAPIVALARGNDLDDVLGTLQTIARTVPGDPLTDPDSALALVTALRRPQRRTETTNLVAVDADGNACALTASLGLGAGVWVPGYGVHLNSMLGEGELVRAELVPGRRMGSMMSPLVVLDEDGELLVAAGAAGGSRIRPALVQTVMRILAGATPQAAIDAPRLAALPDLVRLEPGFADAVIAGLTAAGEEVRQATSLAPYFGGASAVSPLGGGADPRRSGAVVAVPPSGEGAHR